MALAQRVQRPPRAADKAQGERDDHIEAQLIERLKKLPVSRVADVVDLVEFLSPREERAAAVQRLTQGPARLGTLNLPPVSEDEVEAATQTARRARPSRHDARSIDPEQPVLIGAMTQGARKSRKWSG